MIVHILPILKDNYCYVLEKDGQAAVIDPGTAQDVQEFLIRHELNLHSIINTHHHWDHTDGNEGLVTIYNCPVIKPENMGEVLDWQGESFSVLRCPGHTLDHICLYSADHHILFSGDVLFSLGCGRVFEGTHQQMYDSLQKLKSLPDDTLVYCGHEYTQSNGRFALHVDPDNPDLQQRMDDVSKLRAAGQATIPFNLGIDKRSNPFLTARGAQEFSQRRTLKDQL